jgi:undecaprenyl-diphosphatase
MIVQIVCESLPISSSGHTLLLARIMEKFHYQSNIPNHFWAFDYLSQGVSALVFLIYFFKGWLKLCINEPIKISLLLDFNFWLHSIFPIFIFGVIADGITFLFWMVNLEDYIHLPLALGFLMTACALGSIKFAQEKKDIYIWSWKYALIVGFVQGCALLPGISRFGTTIAVLQFIGYQGHIAFLISFLLQWPLIVAASIKGFFYLYSRSLLIDVLNVHFFIIILISAFFAYRVLYAIEKIIDKKLLWKFSYYMIIPIIITLLV